jgi:hypothetical protein
MASSEEHPEKAPLLTDVTEEGIITEEREVQPSNAEAPMVFTFDGIVTEERKEQL